MNTRVEKRRKNIGELAVEHLLHETRYLGKIISWAIFTTWSTILPTMLLAALTDSGPLEKYGPSLVELSAPFGVYYDDTTRQWRSLMPKMAMTGAIVN